MALLSRLHRALASTLRLSSRGEHTLGASLSQLPARLFSSSESSDDENSSSSGSDDDTKENPAPSPPPITSPPAPKRLSRKAREQSWDEASAKERGGPAPRRTRPPPPQATKTGQQQQQRPPREPLPQTPSTAPDVEWAPETISGGFPISSRFYSLIRRARGDTSEKETLSHDTPVGGGGQPSRDDLLLLAEIIEAYVSVAPSPDPRVDGLTPEDHAMLRAMGATLRHTLGSDGRELSMPEALAVASPLTQRVVNTAPPGRIPWECLGVDEERGAVHWSADLTAGRAPEPWRNALLSDAAKASMYAAYKANPSRYSAQNLAAVFKIRPQRVMAILALKEREEAAERDAKTTLRAERGELRELMEDYAFGCQEATGSGERHFVNLPSYPAYAQVDSAALLKRIEEAVGRPADEINPDDLTPELAQQVMGVKSVAELQEDLAKKEEASLIEEFTKALEYNLGRAGEGLSRGNRRVDAPKRPKEGWSLLVTPLGEKASASADSSSMPYVAHPDGARRELNADEKLLVARKTPRRRRRIP